MTSPANTALAALPPATRRRAALALTGFAVLLLIVGVLCLLAGSVALLVIGVFALVAAAAAGLTAGGMWYSVRLDADASRLDQVLTDALAEHPRDFQCDCGHEHDPTELHVTDAEECAHDGAGAACSHDCASCVFQRDATASSTKRP